MKNVDFNDCGFVALARSAAEVRKKELLL